MPFHPMPRFPSLRRPRPGRRNVSIALLLVLGGGLLVSVPARAAFDPARTATIYLHGFELTGARRDGVYGDEAHQSVADSIARFAGLPIASGSGAWPANVVVGVGYYGDAPPAWYTAAERAAVDSVTAAWGGGVPRYAEIAAIFARHVLARSGAQQVNLVGASFGALIARWMIEHDAQGLASSGRIARWLSIEGLVGGNWAASHASGFLDFLSLPPIDLQHMTHGWIEAHLHAPYTELDSPFEGAILMGQVGSTDERYQGSALSALMATARDWQPNDGVQALPDAVSSSVTARARLLGLPPTRALFHATHFGLADFRGAWAEAATFLTQRRRVTVTMTRATVANLHEPELPFWDWRPGEIVFESRVHSPAAARRWGVTDPIAAVLEAGGAAPLRRFQRDGDTQTLELILFDDFVLSEETALDLELAAYDVDYDPHYGVYETVTAPYLDDLGAGTLSISTLAPGTYAFAARDWSAEVTVKITDYPFAAYASVSDVRPRATPVLALVPNPARGPQSIAIPAEAGVARVDVLDVTGRLVRRVATASRGPWHWDGRDAEGRRVPAGVYRVRAVTSRGTFEGRSLIVR